MRCKNFRCIYNKNTRCTAGEILIDQFGKCADCVHPKGNRQKEAKTTSIQQTFSLPPPDNKQEEMIETLLRRIKKPKK